MDKNQIKVKRIANGRESFFTIKNGMVYNAFGKKHIYCGCTGNTEETATPMQYKNGEVFCPNCHEKKVEVIQTYEEWKEEHDEKQRKMNEERLANLHLTEAGSDWECGFKYYTLSAQIEYDDWLKVKEHFRYYRRGWSRGQELEWNYGEPTGWLTQNPDEVEKILLNAGLIKPENTREAIQKRAELEKQKKEAERKEKIAKKQEIKGKMDSLDEKIRKAFDSSEKRELSDAEANEHYFNCDYGRCTVLTHRVTDSEIIRCRHMGDFKYGIAIPYSEEVAELLKEYYRLNKELCGE